MKVSRLSRLFLVVASVLITGSLVSPLASAQEHPRRKEVKRRANREERKNNIAEKNGKITQQQANQLNGQDQAIKREANADAAANGGHLTKQEQRDLNRQENQVNRERRRDERQDARAKAQSGSTQSNGSVPAAASAPASGN